MKREQISAVKSSGWWFLLVVIASTISLKVSATCESGYTWMQTADNIISFTNTSTGTTVNTSYYWGFGDGSSSQDENPVHTYSVPGTYYICLHITDSTCSSYFCDSVTVTGIVLCNLTVSCYEYLHASCDTCANGLAHAFVSGGTEPYAYVWNTNPEQTTQFAYNLLPGTYTVCATDANGCSACCTVTIDTPTCAVSVGCYEYHHSSCDTCADGIAHSYASGGTEPYTYVWNTNPEQTASEATGLLPGTYTVCATDANGCSSCCSVTIDTPTCAVVVACYQYTHASCDTCADGVAHAFPSGGTEPYTYTWDTNPVQTTQFAYNLLPGSYTVCATDVNGCSDCCTVTIDTPTCAVYVGCYEYIHASCDTCADGVAHAYASGGTEPYTYTWDTNPVQTTQFAYNLLPGTYTVCVTDAYGCSGCCTVTIDTPTCAVTIACYEYTHASCDTCADGVAHAFPSGGTEPYTYTWDTNPVQTTQFAYDLSPGTYTVCATDANGCSGCCTVTIDTPACAVYVGCYEYVHASCDTCADGVAHAYASGGTEPYTYTWDTNPVQTTQFAYNLLPGSYTVCATDANGCSSCCTVTIDTPSCDVNIACYQLTPASCDTCADGVAHAYASGGTAPYTYVWNTNPEQTTYTATGLLPGAYTVCATDVHGCSGCCTVTIENDNSGCSAYFYLYPDSSLAHTYWAVNLAYGVEPLHYLWSWGDGTYDTIPYPSHTYSVAGYYTICLTIEDASGCIDSICSTYHLEKSTSAEGEDAIITVNVIPAITSAVPIINVLQAWSAFPNPVGEIAFIQYTLKAPAKVTIELYDVLGKRVKLQMNEDGDAGEHTTFFDTHNLSNGIYILQIHAGGQFASLKIAVMN